MSDIKFTNEQIDYICYKIGEWYCRWDKRLVDYDERTHKLGFAKEQLKMMICPERNKDE